MVTILVTMNQTKMEFSIFIIKGELILRKKIFVVSVIVITSIILLLILFFLKGPIVTRQQAIYYGWNQLRKGSDLSFEAINKLDLKAYKNDEMEQFGFDEFLLTDNNTWWVVDKQIYDFVPGVMGGGVVVKFTKDRENVEVIFLE